MAGSTNVETKNLNHRLLEVVDNLKEADLDGDGEINLKNGSAELAKALDILNAPEDPFQREFSPQKALLVVLDGAVRKSKKEGYGLKYKLFRHAETGVESYPILITNDSIDLQQAKLVLEDEIQKTGKMERRPDNFKQYLEKFSYHLRDEFSKAEKRAEITGNKILTELNSKDRDSFKQKVDLTLIALSDGEKTLEGYNKYSWGNPPADLCFGTYDKGVRVLLGLPPAKEQKNKPDASFNQLCS